MKRYLKIYLTLIRLNYFRILSYRANLTNSLFATLLWGAFSIVSIYVLTAKTGSVYGWSRQELFILVGVFNIIIGGTFRMLFAHNFDRFSRVMQYGELDVLLLKPLDAQFALSLWFISLIGIIRIIIFSVFTIFMILQAGIPITFFNSITFLGLMIFGLIVHYSMWFMVMTLTVWFPDLTNLTEMLYTTDSLTRYPPQVMQELKVFVFYIFFPFTIVVSTPTKALLHKLNSFDVLLLVCMAGGLFFLSRKFWQFALRSYSSASG